MNDKKILNGNTIILSIVHDVAECLIGDITPHDGVAEDEKHMLETNAFLKLVKNLPTGRMALEFYNGFERYEEQHPGDQDARLTKDLDRFDMIVQAYEYEEKSKKGRFLDDFFQSTRGYFKTPIVQSWDVRLRELREKLHAQS